MVLSWAGLLNANKSKTLYIVTVRLTPSSSMPNGGSVAWHGNEVIAKNTRWELWLQCSS